MGREPGQCAMRLHGSARRSWASTPPPSATPRSTGTARAGRVTGAGASPPRGTPCRRHRTPSPGARATTGVAAPAPAAAAVPLRRATAVIIPRLMVAVAVGAATKSTTRTMSRRRRHRRRDMHSKGSRTGRATARSTTVTLRRWPRRGELVWCGVVTRVFFFLQPAPVLKAFFPRGSALNQVNDELINRVSKRSCRQGSCEVMKMKMKMALSGFWLGRLYKMMIYLPVSRNLYSKWLIAGECSARHPPGRGNISFGNNSPYDFTIKKQVV